MSKAWNTIEYKFVLIGDTLVGKSSIFDRICGREFNSASIATIGTDKVNIYFDNLEITKNEQNYKKNFTIVLFDTAGQERYRSITKNYYKGSNGIILIYDITDSQTFEHVSNWLESIKEAISDWKKSNYIVMLLGNKLDVAQEDPEKRQVNIEDAKKFCSDNGIFWGGECSAKTFNEDKIKEIFEKFVKEVFIKIFKDEKNNNNNKNVNLDNKGQRANKKKCC
jgi:Rab family protein